MESLTTDAGHVRAHDAVHDEAATLGMIYGKGEGVPPDYVQAHMWFNLAAVTGSEIALENRDLIAKEMTPIQVAEAQRLAREWLEEHGG